MRKGLYLIIFVILFFITIYYLFKLDSCRDSYQKLTSILHKNTIETRLLNQTVNNLKNKEHSCKVKLIQQLDNNVENNEGFTGQTTSNGGVCTTGSCTRFD